MNAKTHMSTMLSSGITKRRDSAPGNPALAAMRQAGTKKRARQGITISQCQMLKDSIHPFCVVYQRQILLAGGPSVEPTNREVLRGLGLITSGNTCIVFIP